MRRLDILSCVLFLRIIRMRINEGKGSEKIMQFMQVGVIVPLSPSLSLSYYPALYWRILKEAP